MGCFLCGAFDSLMEIYYLDKNQNLMSQFEKTAFEILHPNVNMDFEKVFLCGLCQYGLDGGHD